MINKKLNVGDYIFSASGKLCRITKVNKTTYSYEEITTRNWFSTGNVAFNGIRHGYYENIEFFECSEPQAKAFEIAMKKFESNSQVEKELETIKILLGKAKYFLTQISSIEEIEVEEGE